MRAAFDAVIPGYADAWNKARLDAAEEPARRRNRRWDATRKYLRHADERCLLPYHITGTVGLHSSFRVPRAPNAMLVQNRGYVSLMVVWFSDQQESAQALYAMRDPGVEANNRRRAKNRNKPYEPDSIDSFFWTYDGTDFEDRCKIALQVLRYVRDNGTKIEPVWKQHTPQDLIQES